MRFLRHEDSARQSFGPIGIAGILFVLALLFSTSIRAVDSTMAAQEAQREQAIADYTKKMQDANYPTLFAKAAQEFNVPPDVLMAVSFAETRWTQLEWPPGETASPENGMPRPYGIMSLWDNDYFGHTLQQAAQLVGQDPEALKTDAFQNMRGGAALLRQIYDQTPKPADAPNESQIESWRYAIAKYTGIPQPDLSQGHALRVYEFMNEGYHQYGIEWKGHAVKLSPMREDVARIIAAVRAAKTSNVETKALPMSVAFSPPKEIAAPIFAQAEPAPQPIVPVDNSVENRRQRWYLGGMMVALLAIAFWYLRRRKKG